MRVLRVKSVRLVRQLGLVRLEAALVPNAMRELAASPEAGLASNPSAASMEITN